jgi:hypothetical protein
MHVVIYVYMHVYLKTNYQAEKIVEMSLSLHEIESLFVQRANEVPIHRSFPCPTKGLLVFT